MAETTFDPKSIFEAYRNAFAPMLKVQKEGVNALDRLGRYQYAVAGDYLDFGLAQAKAALEAHSPADFVTKQVELTTSLSDKLRGRVQEFITLATDTQTRVQATFTDAVNEATATVKPGEASKRKAS